MASKYERLFREAEKDVSQWLGLPDCRRTDLASLPDKNSSWAEIANVNFLTTISHTRRPTSKYRKRDKPTSFNKLDDR